MIYIIEEEIDLGDHTHYICSSLSIEDIKSIVAFMNKQLDNKFSLVGGTSFITFAEDSNHKYEHLLQITEHAFYSDHPDNSLLLTDNAFKEMFFALQKKFDADYSNNNNSPWVKLFIERFSFFKHHSEKAKQIESKMKEELV